MLKNPFKTVPAPAPEPPPADDGLLYPNDFCLVYGTFATYLGLIKETNPATNMALVMFFDEAWQETREIPISGKYLGPLTQNAREAQASY